MGHESLKHLYLDDGYYGKLQYDCETDAVPSSLAVYYTVDVTEGRLPIGQASQRWRWTSNQDRFDANSGFGRWSRESDDDPTRSVSAAPDSDDDEDAAETREEPDWERVGNPFDGWRWAPLKIKLSLRFHDEEGRGTHLAEPSDFIRMLACAQWC